VKTHYLKWYPRHAAKRQQPARVLPKRRDGLWLLFDCETCGQPAKSYPSSVGHTLVCSGKCPIEVVKQWQAPLLSFGSLNK